MVLNQLIRKLPTLEILHNHVLLLNLLFANLSFHIYIYVLLFLTVVVPFLFIAVRMLQATNTMWLHLREPDVLDKPH